MDVIQLMQDGKISRYFRSRKKLGYANLISHITQRAAGREVLFVEADDYMAMLSLMKELAEKYRVSLFAFCLMTNHIHLLVRPEEDNLQQFMRDLCGRYAARFNRRYERKGHLFGGPYRQSVVLDEVYLLAVSLYIHLNPVRAGLASHPSEYRFSSCRLYVNKDAPKSFIDPTFILSLLSDKEEERIARYTELLDRGKTARLGNILEDENAIERFVKSLKNSFPAIFSMFHKRSNKLLDAPLSGSFEENIEKYENLRELRTHESLEAKKYCIEQLIARGYTRSQVAEQLRISRKTVYNLLYLKE
jgi:putative transposase